MVLYTFLNVIGVGIGVYGIYLIFAWARSIYKKHQKVIEIIGAQETVKVLGLY